MGYNSTVFILNDHLSTIKNNPQKWVEEVVSAIHCGEEVDVMGQTTVMRTQHADVHRLYATHGNAMIDLSYPYQVDKEFSKYGGDEEQFNRMVSYYKEQIKIAKRTLREWEKNIKALEEKQAVNK